MQKTWFLGVFHMFISISRGQNEAVGNEGLPVTAIGTLNKCSIKAFPIIQKLLLVLATLPVTTAETGRQLSKFV